MLFVYYVIGFFRKCIKCVRENISCFYIVLISVCLINLWGGVLADKIFIDLWNLLELKEGRSLQFLIYTLCLGFVYYGWHFSKKHIDSQSYTILAIIFISYAYYKWVDDSFSFLNAIGQIDCFQLLAFALLIGFILGKISEIKGGQLSTLKCSPQPTEPLQSEISPLQFYRDEPVCNVKYDRYHFAEFAKRLSATIRQREFTDSYSIGITAPWGAGKTSMLNFLRDDLLQYNDVIIIDFNARVSANVNCIQSDFLSIIATQLSQYHTGMKSVVKDYMEDLNVLARDTIWSKVLGIIHINDATDSREKIQKAVAALNKKIVILIDDLDRLTGEEILEVLKLINKNASFQNTVFVTAYDKQYVNTVLGSVVCCPEGRDFTDKYFNMELPLPESLNNQRSSFLFYELKRLFREGFITNLTEQDIEQSFLHVVGLAENYLPTMRDVKRFMSAFCASYLPLQKNVKFSDFFIVSLLKYAEPNIYERLKLKDFFDIVSDFAYDYRNIYILKADEKHMKQPYFDALRLMFPQHTSGDLESMNKKGYLHVYWKNCFDTYFFNMEYYKVYCEDLDRLLKKNIKDAEVKQLFKQWEGRYINTDIRDYLLMIKDNQNTQEQLAEYLKIGILCYKYTHDEELFSIFCRYLYYYSWGEWEKKFDFLSKEEYKNYIKKVLECEDDLTATTAFLQKVLSSQISNKELRADDCVFTDSELSDICLIRLQRGIALFKEGKLNPIDIYDLFLACIKDIAPKTSEADGYILMPEAIRSLTESMYREPQRYIYNMVSHQMIDSHTIKFIFNSDIPFRKIFCSNDDFVNYIRSIETEGNNKLRKATNFLSEYFELCKTQHTNQPIFTFKGKADKVKPYSYATYELILESETIE